VQRKFISMVDSEYKTAEADHGFCYPYHLPPVKHLGFAIFALYHQQAG
jgi:hypothetical protein